MKASKWSIAASWEESEVSSEKKSDWKKIVYLVLKLYICRRKKRRYNKKQWTKRKVLSRNLYQGALSLWVSHTNIACPMSPAGGTVWKLLKQYFKLLKKLNYEIGWPLLEQTKQQLWVAKTLVHRLFGSKMWEMSSLVIGLCLLHFNQLPLCHIFHEFDGDKRTVTTFRAYWKASAWICFNMACKKFSTNSKFKVLSATIWNCRGPQQWSVLCIQNLSSCYKGCFRRRPKVIAGGRSLLFTLVNFRLPHIEILYFRAQPLKFFASNGKVSSQSLFSCWFHIKQNNRLAEGSQVFFMSKKEWWLPYFKS